MIFLGLQLLKIADISYLSKLSKRFSTEMLSVVECFFRKFTYIKYIPQKILLSESFSKENNIIHIVFFNI